MADGEVLASGRVGDEEESVWQTARSDFTQAAGIRLLGVAALFAWMAFQWGWGNDILLPPIVARAFEAVDDGDTWASAIGSVLAGTGAGSLFWGLTQTLDGVIVLSGLRLVPATTARLSRFLKRQGWVKPYSELSLGARYLIAYVSGASVLCLVDVFATGKLGVTTRWKILAGAVALSVAGVAVTVAVVTTVTAVGRRVPATADAAEVILRYARNPLTWLVIYGTIVGGPALFRRLWPGSAAGDLPKVGD